MLHTVGAVSAASGRHGGSTRAWTGVWMLGDKEIRMRSARHGRLAIDGEAYWGGDDPFRVNQGGVHEADFSVAVAPRGAWLHFAVSVRDGTAIGDADPAVLCHLTMRLIGDRLVVANPDECGGSNVTFSGSYHRRMERR